MPSNQPPDAREIAGKLTAAQRAALVNAHWHGCGGDAEEGK